MSPEQHAKVLEALEIAQPARCGQSDELYAQEAALIREARSIMRAEGVGDDAKDAERYRTIRGQNWSDGEFCVVMRPRENVRLGALCPSGTLLDDLVDAAAIRGRGE